MKAKLLFFIIGLFFLVCAHHIISASGQQNENKQSKVKVISFDKNDNSN